MARPPSARCFSRTSPSPKSPPRARRQTFHRGFTPQISLGMDCSYKRDKTLTRLIRTEGFGCAVREGAEVVVRFSVHAPGPGGRHGPAEILLYDSDHGFPHGLCMAHGRTLHAEALDRGLLGLKEGSVADLFCLEAAAAADSVLGIEQPVPVEPLPDAPEGVTRWRLRLESVASADTPQEMDGARRLAFCEESKAFGSELFRAGLHERASRRYKKAMLDLEVPIKWSAEQNATRNALRLQCHLNIAACALKAATDNEAVHHEAVHHATKALEIDPSCVKALFRRAQARLDAPPTINHGVQARVANPGKRCWAAAHTSPRLQPRPSSRRTRSMICYAQAPAIPRTQTSGASLCVLARGSASSTAPRAALQERCSGEDDAARVHSRTTVGDFCAAPSAVPAARKAVFVPQGSVYTELL